MLGHVTFVVNAVGGATNHLLGAFGAPAAVPLVAESVTTAVVFVLTVLILIWHRATIVGGRRASLNVPVPLEASPSWQPSTVLPLADRKLVIEGDSTRMRCFDPCSGAPLGSGFAPVMSADQVRAAVAAARRAQGVWAKKSYAARGEVLRYINDYVVAHQEDICRVASRDTGKTMVDAAFGEVLTTCEKIQWTLANGEAALRTEHRSVGLLTLHKTARVEYTPIGVLAAIIPWNYPFHNMLGQIISALFAGNALVVKVSEHASWSSSYYAAIVQQALTQCGHSADLLQIVTGFGATGAALINSGVDKITFIGSPGVGKLVMKQAAETLTPVVLELGGKDAAVVCDDCDFDQVVNLTLRGTFQNCGQNCIGLERLVVQAPLYDRFVAVMQAKVGSLCQGPPMTGTFDCGAMTMGPAQMTNIQALVDDAVAHGARLLVGGKPNAAFPGGPFYLPTLVVDVTPDMKIAQHEVFGPVMAIFKFTNDADAVRIVNACEYGLGSSVFSLSYARAERIARALSTGMANINDFGVNYLCQGLPFGGVKISGFDRFAGVEGLRGCCTLRAITTDRVAGVRTNIPPPLQYPVKASGFKFCAALVGLFYGDGLWARLKAVGALILIAASEPSKK